MGLKERVAWGHSSEAGAVRVFRSSGLTAPQLMATPNQVSPAPRAQSGTHGFPTYWPGCSPPGRGFAPTLQTSGESSHIPLTHGAMLTSEIECRGKGLVHGDADPAGTQRGEFSTSQPQPSGGCSWSGSPNS